MSDTLKVFGKEYNEIEGIKAIDSEGGTKTYIRPQGTKSIGSNGTYDVGLFSSAEVSVSSDVIGKMENGTGIYAPSTISPAAVGNGSFLITEANGTTLGGKSLSVTTGINLTLNSTASAGATTYTVSNTYENRIKAFCLIDGVLALDEANAANTIAVTSVKVGNSDVAPSSTNSSTDIVITTASSVNPSDSTSSVRGYPAQTGTSNLFVGQGINSANGNFSLLVGQGVYSGKNTSCIVGSSIYNGGHGSALFGRQHINKKARAFMAGTGHDSSNAPSEGSAAFGVWSQQTADTLFVVGNGTDNVTRSNAFEVRTDGIVLKSPNGTKYKISVANDGTLSTTSVS